MYSIIHNVPRFFYLHVDVSVMLCLAGLIVVCPVFIAIKNIYIYIYIMQL